MSQYRDFFSDLAHAITVNWNGVAKQWEVDWPALSVEDSPLGPVLQRTASTVCWNVDRLSTLAGLGGNELQWAVLWCRTQEEADALMEHLGLE